MKRPLYTNHLSCHSQSSFLTVKCHQLSLILSVWTNSLQNVIYLFGNTVLSQINLFLVYFTDWLVLWRWRSSFKFPTWLHPNSRWNNFISRFAFGACFFAADQQYSSSWSIIAWSILWTGKLIVNKQLKTYFNLKKVNISRKPWIFKTCSFCQFFYVWTTFLLMLFLMFIFTK